MFFPSCIVSEVIVVTIKDNNIRITVKNIVVVNSEAMVFLILNFLIKYFVGILSSEAKIRASTKGRVYPMVPKKITKKVVYKTKKIVNLSIFIRILSN